MRLTARVSFLGLAAMAAVALSAVACSESESTNNPAAGGKTSTAQGGGSATEGGAATATGGAATTPAGGAAAASGGAATANGGSTSSGTCNYPTASNPPPGTACTTEVKNAACTNEGAVCYKSCGPTNSSGWKTETCTNSVIVEVSACVWTGTDYSAFKVPATAAEMNPACPATTPQASSACTVDGCISCSSPTGSYLDSQGAPKSGYCTCVHKADGSATWSCGTSGTAWPCPGQAGC